jgi:hypothetical protein
MRYFLCYAIITLNSIGLLGAQPKTDSLMRNLLLRGASDKARIILDNPDSFRLQIIYTQIDRDKNNSPSFTNHYYNVDPLLYYNPASTVKLPLALLSLEKINRLARKDVTRDSYIQFDSSYSGQVAALYDSTSSSPYFPSLSHYIRKAFLVSDNDAYNRLYQFVGQGPINDWLAAKGYTHTRIIRQFMGFNEEQNRHTNQVRFMDKSGKTIYTQPAAYNEKPIAFDRTIKVGTSHLDRNGNLVNQPIDFSRANDVALEDLQRMLQAVMFPESFSASQRFLLTKDDLAFLRRFLSQYPSETNYPKYDSAQYFDSYVKFFFKQGSHQMPPNVRVFNKVGWAYGFLTDVSYVVDFDNRIEYFLTATIYVNSDGTVNDDQYDYEQTGWPFLFEIGQAIYRYDLSRERKRKPDLSNFKIRYEKRDPNDKRVPLRNIDND